MLDQKGSRWRAACGARLEDFVDYMDGLVEGSGTS